MLMDKLPFLCTYFVAGLYNAECFETCSMVNILSFRYRPITLLMAACYSIAAVKHNLIIL